MASFFSIRLRPILAVLVALLVAGCMETNRFKYRLTVDVETPEGTKSAATIIEVFHCECPTPIWGMANAPHLHAEGAFLELGQGRVLAVLLYTPTADMAVLPAKAFGQETGPDGKRSGLFRSMAQLPTGSSRELPPSFFPVALVFMDSSDPNSAAEINPSSASKANGYRVLRAAIEIVPKDTLVPDTIRQHLPWWGVRQNGSIDALKAAGLRDLPVMAGGNSYFSIHRDHYWW